MVKVVRQYNVNDLIERLCEFREQGMGEAIICLSIGEHNRSLVAVRHEVVHWHDEGEDAPCFNGIILTANAEVDSSLVADPVPFTDENRESWVRLDDE